MVHDPQFGHRYINVIWQRLLFALAKLVLKSPKFTHMYSQSNN